MSDEIPDTRSSGGGGGGGSGSGSGSDGAVDHLERRIQRVAPSLTPAESRVVEVLAADPGVPAFGTVSDVAGRAGVGVATVMRSVAKLGYRGYTELQADTREQMRRGLRSAAERLRSRSDGRTAPGHHDLVNIETTFAALDPGSLDRCTRLLGDTDATVVVLAGDGARGLAVQFVDELSSLRAGVHLLDGSAVTLQRRAALLAGPVVAVAIDVARYDRWLTELLTDRGEWRVIAVTDHPLAPLAALATEVLRVDTTGAGPFENHTATLAVLQTLTAETARRVLATAAPRLDAVEAAWTRRALLIDRTGGG